jgi:hypothetical protein
MAQYLEYNFEGPELSNCSRYLYFSYTNFHNPIRGSLIISNTTVGILFIFNSSKSCTTERDSGFVLIRDYEVDAWKNRYLARVIDLQEMPCANGRNKRRRCHLTMQINNFHVSHDITKTQAPKNQDIPIGNGNEKIHNLTFT